MTYINLLLVIIAIGVVSAIIGTLTALADEKVRQKISLSSSNKNKRNEQND